MDIALMRLLEDKDLEFISVKEICACAGVNRSTFYLHYETIDDLLRETAEYLVDDFLRQMRAHGEMDVGTDDADGENGLFYVTRKYLLPYLTYIKENRRLFGTALKRSRTLQLNRSYEGLVAHVIDPALDRYGIELGERAYIVAFFMKGLMAVVEEWLRRDCADDVEHIAALMQALVQAPGSSPTRKPR